MIANHRERAASRSYKAKRANIDKGREATGATGEEETTEADGEEMTAKGAVNLWTPRQDQKLLTKRWSLTGLREDTPTLVSEKKLWFN